MIKESLDAIISEVEKHAPNLKNRADFDAFKSTISGPKGKLTELMKLMGKVPKEKKPEMGKAINLAKQSIQNTRRVSKWLLSTSGDILFENALNFSISIPFYFAIPKG